MLIIGIKRTLSLLIGIKSPLLVKSSLIIRIEPIVIGSSLVFESSLLVVIKLSSVLIISSGILVLVGILLELSTSVIVVLRTSELRLGLILLTGSSAKSSLNCVCVGVRVIGVIMGDV